MKHLNNIVSVVTFFNNFYVVPLLPRSSDLARFRDILDELD